MFTSNFNNSLSNRQSYDLGGVFSYAYNNAFNKTSQSVISQMNPQPNEKRRPISLNFIGGQVGNYKKYIGLSYNKNNSIDTIGYPRLGLGKDERKEQVKVLQSLNVSADLRSAGVEGFLNLYKDGRDFEYFNSTPIRFDGQDAIDLTQIDYYEIHFPYIIKTYQRKDGTTYTRKEYRVTDYTNPTSGKKTTRRGMLYTQALIRRLLNPNVDFKTLLCCGVYDVALRYDNNDKALTPNIIINTIAYAFTLPFADITVTLTPSNKKCKVNPNVENKRKMARLMIGKINRNQRQQHIDNNLTDAENTAILNERGIKVSRRTITNQRIANGIPSMTERRESVIRELYNPTLTKKQNLDIINTHSGMTISMSTLKRWMSKQRKQQNLTGTSPEPHQTLNDIKPIQITTDMEKDDQRALNEAVTNNNIISHLERAKEERSNLGVSAPAPQARTYTEEEQKMLDEINERYKAYAAALEFEGYGETIEDEISQESEDTEVWDYEMSDTWGAVLNERLIDEYKELFRSILLAVADDEMNEFNDLFNDYISSLTEECDDWEIRKLEKLGYMLLDEMEGLGYNVDAERDAIRFRNV